MAAKNLKLIRLFTGEDFLGDVIEDTATTITVHNCVRIMVFPNKNDETQPGVAFVPFTQWSNDKDITLNRHHVLAVLTPRQEFVTQYNETFSGLILPESKIITT